MKIFRLLPLLLVVFGVSGFTECYRPVTRSGMPKHIKNIAVPAFTFEAKGLRYRVESRFTEAVTKEMIRRGGGLKVQGSREGADARSKISAFRAYCLTAKAVPAFMR